jgi:hypothetical protein
MGRWGPDPALPSAEVASVTQNQAMVLNYLVCNAHIAPCDGELVYPALTSDGWFQVVQWGFNVGRQDCEVYLDNLFRMAREKSRNDAILTALGTYAAAIVTGTAHAQKPLSIIAAALGFTMVLNDATYDSFLFAQAPALVAKKVADLQAKYRSSVAKSDVATAADAYRVIQEYYRICLPHVIEGVMLQTISDAQSQTPTGQLQGTRRGATPSAPRVLTPELR